MIYADQRWIGDHGIGRFANQVVSSLVYEPVPLLSSQSSPLDPWLLSRALGKLTRNDLFFSPGYNSPLSCSAPFVFTIHDLNHIDRPENTSTLKRFYYTAILKPACHRAASILTVSEFSRARIIDWSGVAPKKVINVNCGVDSAYHAEGASYGLPFPYLLCVSNRKLHKNELRTVAAFAQANIAAELHLVFTGQPTAALADYIEHHKVSSRIHFVGRVADSQLPSLYRGAEALIFVSLYEGFGLPVLEAMACGTPAVTSNSSALREIAGDAALLVDPTSVEMITKAMEQIVSDSSLRLQLRLKGLAQAAKFPWTNTIARVQELLTSITIGGGSR
jgi:glycosyltransferase involved in cell wall biosynthesis